MSETMIPIPKMVWGGVYIPPNGGKTLKDLYNDNNMGLTLTNETVFSDTAQFYINLYPKVSCLKITQTIIGYVDNANIDDLTGLWFLEGNAEDDYLQQSKVIHSFGALAETPTTNPPHIINHDPPLLAKLDNPGKLYFMNQWGTAVIDCGIDEFFYIIVKGEILRRHVR